MSEKKPVLDFKYDEQIWVDWVNNSILPSSQVADQTFYVTTAINYTNGSPHIGHAYEAITADIIARYNRIYGRTTYFLTGTDEHGQKIAETAAAKNMTPIELCDFYANQFKELNKRIFISNDHFIRTTEPKHHILAQYILQKALDAGDIFLGSYSGWYNVREETFVTENEAKLSDYKDPSSGVPLKKMEESSYFFRLSKYKDALLNHINQNPEFIQPAVQRDFILKRLEDDLLDLSISRITFSWGIPLPNDPKHVMYVWFDALTNYLTGVDWPNGEKSKFWPANLQIVGKDITWFHCVIWPCMLLSTGIPLPKTVFGHGFIHDSQNRKMSKSLGNTVDPIDLLNQYPADSFRLSLINGNPFGGDIPFSEKNLILSHNADIASTIGNLVNRCAVILQKNTKGIIVDVEPEEIFNVNELKEAIEREFSTFNLHVAYEKAINAVKDINLYLTKTAPWKIKDSDDPDFTRRNIILRSALEAIYISAHFLSPFLPETSARIFATLSTSPVAISSLSTHKNLKVGTSIFPVFEFHKVGSDDKEERKQEAEASKAAKLLKKEQSKNNKNNNNNNAAEGNNDNAVANNNNNKKNNNNNAGNKGGKGGNNNNNNNAGNKGGKNNAAASDDQHIFTKLDIRVGFINKAWPHPDSSKLYCEEIDVGEAEPRAIASGLQQKIPLDKFQGQKVLVVTNLKPAKLAGFMSSGMVLCANGPDDKVELISPPPEAKVGERVFLPNIDGPPATAAQVKNKKIWEAVAPHLITDSNAIATFDGALPFTTSAGVCKAESLTEARIS